MGESIKVCESCGKPILYNEEAIEVRYGKMGATAHPHWKVFPKRVDFFHANCEVAIRKRDGINGRNQDDPQESTVGRT